MNKIIKLSALSLILISGASHASFTLTIPLSNKNSASGLLPDNAIRFVKAGDGTGLPPTEIITPPPIVEGGSAETEYSEEQSCLVESNSKEAKAQIEQYPNAVFGGLFYSSSSEKPCIAHAYLPKKNFDSTCKASNGNKLNIIISNMNNTTMFGFTYELTGGC